MPSFMIHLLVGEKYCEFNRISDKTKLLLGNFAPDLNLDKNISHFSKDVKTTSFTEVLVNKIDINKLSKVNLNLNDDYEKGVLLHLLTDYYFYNKYLIYEPNYLKYNNKTYTEMKELIYKEYDIVDYWIRNNYPNLSYSLLPDTGRTFVQGKMKIFSKNSIKKIVNYCSKLNLEKIYKKLIKSSLI